MMMCCLCFKLSANVLNESFNTGINNEAIYICMDERCDDGIVNGNCVT